MKSLLEYLKSKVFLLNLILAVVSLPIVVWIIMKGLNSYTDNGNTDVLVDLPILKGVSIEEAALRLEVLGLSYEVIDSTFVDGLPLGAIVEQFPRPTLLNTGDSTVLRKVKRDRKIFLTVNKSAKPQKNIGTFFGKPFQEVEMQLKYKGFHIDGDTVGVMDNRVGPNCVTGITVKGGKKVNENDQLEYGTKLKVFVNKKGVNQMMVSVPNVMGMPLKDAYNKIKSKSLNMFVTNADALANGGDSLSLKVISQTPQANGNREYPGSVIKIEVGK